MINKKLITSVVVLLVAFLVIYLFAFPVEAPVTSSPEGVVVDDVIEISLPDTSLITEEVESFEAVLLDVRTEEERNEDGYIAISTHFDVQKLRDGLTPKLDPNTKIYIHCKSGKRAEEAVRILSQNGYTDLTNIGGLVDWENEGGEVVR